MTTSNDPDAATPWSPESILAALADPSQGMRVKDQLRYEPSGDALVEALRRAATAHERRVLCDVLGDRHEKLAVAALVEQLDRDDVRSEAADALAKIGDPAAGGALAGCFARESDVGTRAMLAAALGAVGHRAAIPDLLRALEDASASVRGSAAWSLAHLKAREAAEPLQAALDREPPGYARTRLEEAAAALDPGEPEG